MVGCDFYTQVSEHTNLEWLGAREGKTPSEDDVLIRFKDTDAKFAVSISAIRENTWDDLFAVMSGQRSPRIMTHITRIVGYYSQLQNWNRSKIAELHDRHRGDYDLHESTVVPMTETVPAMSSQPASAVA